MRSRRKFQQRLVGALLTSVPFIALALIVYFMLTGRPGRHETQLVVVQPGDTLSAIGKRFDVAPNAIAELNAIENPSRIWPNQVLLVPRGPEARVPRTLKKRIAEITQVPQGVRPRRWRHIVVHHSASPSGGARSIGEFHTNVRRWRNGLGYHFVIGNGTDTPDGLVEASPRWAKQLHGAHAKSSGDRMNRVGIGICLVGNFEEMRPTKAQMRTLVELVRRLQRRFDIPTRNVIGHRHVLEGHTVCPGKNFSIERLRTML